MDIDVNTLINKRKLYTLNWYMDIETFSIDESG